MNESTLIYRRKLTLGLLVLGAFAFVVLGAFLFFYDQTSVRMDVVGVVCIIFFGGCGLYGLKALVDKEPGLKLDSEGLTDNSSALAAGFVPWSDVFGVEECQVQGQKSICLLLKNPEVYIERGSYLRRMTNRTRTIANCLFLLSIILWLTQDGPSKLRCQIMW